MPRIINQPILLFRTILLVLFVVIGWECKNQQLSPAQYNRNFCEFVINPFKSEFNRSGDFKQNIINNFGKPLSIEKFYGYLRENSNIRIDETRIHYKTYKFTICRTKYFKIIRYIDITDFSDIKYNITTETTMEDIEALFGKKKESRTDLYYRFDQCANKKWKYLLYFHFKNNKLDGISIEKRYNIYKYD